MMVRRCSPSSTVYSGAAALTAPAARNPQESAQGMYFSNFVFIPLKFFLSDPIVIHHDTDGFD
jgi:hypothetical protein